MSTRRTIHVPPPDPPEVARLQVQRATRGVRERGRWFGAFSLATFGTSLWIGGWLLYVPPTTFGCLFVALPGLVVGVAGCVYFGLPLVDEGARWLLFVAGARQEIDLRAEVVRGRLETLDRHADRWYGRPPAKTRYVAVRMPDNATEPAKAKAPERITQSLPALPPTKGSLPGSARPYAGTPAAAIVAALASGAPCSVRQRPGGLGRPDFDAAVAALRGVGVVAPYEPGRALALAPRYAAMAAAPALLADEVARALDACPPPPGV